MERYNIFRVIHKSLRAMMYDAALAIQQANFEDAEETEKCLLKIDEVIFRFEKHVVLEEKHVISVIKTYEPGLVHAFESDHAENVVAGNRLENLMNIYRHCYFSEEKIETGRSVELAFVEYMSMQLGFMERKEMLLNEALWRHFTDAHIKKLHRSLISSIPKDDICAGIPWMLKSINNAEIVQWITDFITETNATELARLLQLVRALLPVERFLKISNMIETNKLVVN